MTVAPPKPPPREELEALIKEARARQLRRRLIGAVWVAVVAAVGLTTYSLLNAGRTLSESGAPRGAAPLCRSSQLSVAAIWDGAAGHLFNFFTITNKGAEPCSLPSGRPAVVLTRDGAQLRVEQRAPAGSPYPGKPVDSFAPGRRAIVHLSWWNWCGPQLRLPQQATNVTLQFADGLRVTARGLLGQPPCIDAAHPSVITAGRPLTPGPGEL